MTFFSSATSASSCVPQLQPNQISVWLNVYFSTNDIDTCLSAAQLSVTDQRKYKMKETLRDTAPGPRVVADPILSTEGTTATSTTGTNQSTHLSNQYTELTSSSNTVPHETKTTPNSLDNSTNSNDDVVSQLQRNVQASVKETTGRSDPDVAEDLGSKSAGKQFLEGLGLGGDERKTTLRSVNE